MPKDKRAKQPAKRRRTNRKSKDTPKIAQHRAEVKQRVNRTEQLQRSKAECEDFSLDIEEGTGESDSESELPDITEVVRGSGSPSTRRSILIEKIRVRDNRDVSNMEEKELESIWAQGKRDKKMFSRNTKVQADGPAQRIGSPKKSQGHSVRDRSPARAPDKRSRRDEPDRSRIEQRKYSQDKLEGKRGAYGNKSSIKPSKPRSYSTHSHENYTQSSSRASSVRDHSHASSVRSSSHGRSIIGEYDDNEDEDATSGSDTSRAYSRSYGEESDGDEGSERELDDAPKKAKKGKAKSGDYRGVEREILDHTVELLELHLVTVDYFPDPRKLVTITRAKWEVAVKHRDLSMRDFPIDRGHVDTCRFRLQSFRSRLRDKAKDAGLLTAYGLEGIKQGSSEAISIVDSLLPHGLHRKPGAAEGYGFFQHPFLRPAAAQMFFTGRRPIGKRYPDKFGPSFPLKVMAVMCAIIHGALEGYKVRPKLPGKKQTKDEKMSLASVQEYYSIHRKSSKLFESEQGAYCRLVMPAIYKYCVEHSGGDSAAFAPPPQKRKIQVLTAEQFGKNDPSPEDMMEWGVDPLVAAESSPKPKPTPRFELSSPFQEPPARLKAKPKPKPTPVVETEEDEAMVPRTIVRPKPKPTVELDEDEDEDVSQAIVKPRPKPKLKPKPKPTVEMDEVEDEIEDKDEDEGLVSRAIVKHKSKRKLEPEPTVETDEEAAVVKSKPRPKPRPKPKPKPTIQAEDEDDEKDVAMASPTVVNSQSDESLLAMQDLPADKPEITLPEDGGNGTVSSAPGTAAKQTPRDRVTKTTEAPSTTHPSSSAASKFSPSSAHTHTHTKPPSVTTSTFASTSASGRQTTPKNKKTAVSSVLTSSKKRKRDINSDSDFELPVVPVPESARRTRMASGSLKSPRPRSLGVSVVLPRKGPASSATEGKRIVAKK
ncbi:hypothetical protein RSAG8_12535, partial [Rhizoctonia solani AG-8 WAC10335]